MKRNSSIWSRRKEARRSTGFGRSASQKTRLVVARNTKTSDTMSAFGRIGGRTPSQSHVTLRTKIAAEMVAPVFSGCVFQGECEEWRMALHFDDRYRFQ